MAPNHLFSSFRSIDRVGSIPIARSNFRWLTLAYVVLGWASARFSVPTGSMRPAVAGGGAEMIISYRTLADSCALIKWG